MRGRADVGLRLGVDREKTIATTSGDLTVKIHQTRTGSFFPSLLHPRRRIDVALHAVVMEAYVHGVSTRKVDDLVAALGAESGISKSEVSRICGKLDEEVATFNGRDLSEQAHRCLRGRPPLPRQPDRMLESLLPRGVPL